MPIHDWTKVKAGIFHAFHHEWISQIAHALNDGLLPPEYYAMPEQAVSEFIADVLTLKGAEGPTEPLNALPSKAGQGVGTLSAPRLKPVAESELTYYRRKQKAIAIRSEEAGDSLISVIEIVSSGNKSGRKPMRAFVEKTASLLDKGIHMMVLDLYPPGRRDPHGIHAEIWSELEGDDTEYLLPIDKPLTLASYESELGVRAYVNHVAVGDRLPEMPLFLMPQKTVSVPLEETYNAAFAAVPKRWRTVIESETT